MDRFSKASAHAAERKGESSAHHPSLWRDGGWPLGSSVDPKFSASMPSFWDMPTSQSSAAPPEPELSCLPCSYKLISCHQWLTYSSPGSCWTKTAPWGEEHPTSCGVWLCLWPSSGPHAVSAGEQGDRPGGPCGHCCSGMLAGPLSVAWGPRAGLVSLSVLVCKKHFKNGTGGFTGCSVVEGLSCSAGDTGSIPGLGGSHMPQSS